MPDFVKGPNLRSPFGVNEWLRSTRGIITESYTMAASGIPTETIDGVATKNLKSGTVIAKITSGADSGKFGVFDSGASDGRQTTTNIVGISNTDVPWQLNERDVEIAVVKHGRGYQARCFEYVAGVRAALGDTTAAALLAKKDLDILFLTGSTLP